MALECKENWPVIKCVLTHQGPITVNAGLGGALLLMVSLVKVHTA